MPPPVAFPARRRLTWRTWLDMPVGVTLPSAGAAGAIHLQGPGIAFSGPYLAGIVPGWLAVVGISNAGWSPVRGGDFAARLAFSFPGRQVVTAWAAPEPAARTARPPEVRLLPASRPGDSGTGRVEVAGDFLLRPGDVCTLTLILTGAPASHRPLVQQHGALTAGKITGDPGTGCPGFRAA
jgi:hypothetical protein